MNPLDQRILAALLLGSFSGVEMANMLSQGESTVYYHMNKLAKCGFLDRMQHEGTKLKYGKFPGRYKLNKPGRAYAEALIEDYS